MSLSYSNTDANGNSLPVFTVIGTVPPGVTIGQRNALSEGDIAAASSLYSSWVALRYAALFGALGPLGLPLNSEYSTVDVGRCRDYTYGTICYHAPEGAFAVYDSPSTAGIYARWVALGRENGLLGYPVSNVIHEANGWRSCYFENGLIRWNSTAGTTDKIYSNPAGFMDGATPRVFYKDPATKTLVSTRFVSGNWVPTDVSQFVSPPTARSGVSAYTGSSAVRAVYRDDGGGLYEVSQDSSGWHAVSLNGLVGAPPAAGRPTGYVSGGTSRAVYRDANGHVQELWLSSTGWSAFDVTSYTGAPVALGEPMGYADGGVTRVVYRDANGHIQELWLDSTGWHSFDISNYLMAPVAGGDPSGYIGGGIPRVVYRDTSRHIVELLMDSTGWHSYDITAYTFAPLAVGDPMGYMAAGSPRVVYRAANGHIYELFIDTTGNWSVWDMNTIWGAVLAAGDPMGFADGSGAHVVYLGTDGAIHEFVLNGSWQHRQVSP